MTVRERTADGGAITRERPVDETKLSTAITEYERPEYDESGVQVRTVTAESNECWMIEHNGVKRFLRKGRHADWGAALEVDERAVGGSEVVTVTKIDPRDGTNHWGPSRFTGAQADALLALVADQEI